MDLPMNTVNNSNNNRLPWTVNNSKSCLTLALKVLNSTKHGCGDPSAWRDWCTLWYGVVGLRVVLVRLFLRGFKASKIYFEGSQPQLSHPRYPATAIPPPLPRNRYHIITSRQMRPHTVLSNTQTVMRDASSGGFLAQYSCASSMIETPFFSYVHI